MVNHYIPSMLSARQLTQLRREAAESGNRIKAARRLAGLTQTKLADQIAIPQSQISDDETGKSPALSLQKARTYADFFGCAIEDLFPAREQVAS